MGIKFYGEPPLVRPDMIACWPGIGNIGIISVDILRNQLQAGLLAEIEPYDFFYPRKVVVKAGVLQSLEFPSSKFYFKKLADRDLLIFLGEEQPAGGGRLYAEGKKAYQMANLVLEVAAKFGCRRIYTSGAAVSIIHHIMKPRVWSVTNNEDLLKEVRSLPNTILMGEVEGMGDQGSITGLNGLLLGLAKNKGFDAICLMGEIPDYLSGALFPYPRASRSILEVLAGILGITFDYSSIDDLIARVDTLIAGIYEKFPQEIKERIEQRKSLILPQPEAINEEDQKWIKEHIDELFKRGGKGDERPT